MSPLTLKLDTVHLSDEQFYHLQQQVEVYRQKQNVEVRNLPTELSGEDVLPAFSLSLSCY